MLLQAVLNIPAPRPYMRPYMRPTLVASMHARTHPHPDRCAVSCKADRHRTAVRRDAACGTAALVDSYGNRVNAVRHRSGPTAYFKDIARQHVTRASTGAGLLGRSPVLTSCWVDDVRH